MSEIPVRAGGVAVQLDRRVVAEKVMLHESVASVLMGAGSRVDQQRVLIWQDAFYQDRSTTLILEGAGVEHDKACHCVSEYVSQNYGSSSPEEDYDENNLRDRAINT